jgi:hypothetical protein
MRRQLALLDENIEVVFLQVSLKIQLGLNARQVGGPRRFLHFVGGQNQSAAGLWVMP